MCKGICFCEMDEEGYYCTGVTGVSSERTTSVSVFSKSTKWVFITYGWTQETTYVCCGTNGSYFRSRSQMGILRSSLSSHNCDHDFAEITYLLTWLEYHSCIFTFK